MGVLSISMWQVEITKGVHVNREEDRVQSPGTRGSGASGDTLARVPGRGPAHH